MNGKTLTVDELLDFTLNTRFFGDDDEPGPLHARWLKGAPDSKLVVVLGDNAVGKSFFRRIVQSACGRLAEPRVECITLSMEDRVGGVNLFGAMKSMIYGDEGHFATGSNSANLVLTGIETAKGRKASHVVFWDEPDVGLSDEYALDIGTKIGHYALNANKHTKALFVVTHRRSLVTNLLAAAPHIIFMGENCPYKTVGAWLNRATISADVSALRERQHQLFLKISKLLKKDSEQ